MKRILNFSKFDISSRLVENINAAREELSKINKKKEWKDLSDKEKEEIESIPKFIQVRKEFERRNPRLIFPLTKFYIMEDAPWEKVLEIATKLEELKPNPKELKLGPIENYAKLPANSNPPGYVQLEEDLKKMIEERESRKAQPKEVVQKTVNIRPEIELLVKEYAKKKKVDPETITQEEKIELAKDHRYLKIKETFLNKKPEWVYPFTKFFCIENCKWEKIMEIADKLEKYKPTSDELRFGNIKNYADLTSKQSSHPGWETLEDDIERIVMGRKAKKMIDLFQSARMREKYRQVAASDSPKDKKRIEELIFIANRLETLEPPQKLMLDKKTNLMVMKTPMDAFVEKSRKYDDFENIPGVRPATYPQFKDPEVAFDSIIKDGFGEIEGWTSGIADLRSKLQKLKPASQIVFDDDNYIVSSARTADAMIEVCKIVSGGHCIRTEGNFWSYTGGGLVQLNISDFNLSEGDPLRLYTMTIHPDGKIKTSANANNNESEYSKYKNKHFTEVLKSMGYPQSMIVTLDTFFPLEQKIKMALERFYRLQKNPTQTDVLTALTKVHEGVLEGVMDEESWFRICGVVAEIVKIQMNLSDKDFIQYFIDNGIVFESDFIIFKHVIGDNYTPEEAAGIQDSTYTNIEYLEGMLEDPSIRSKLSKDKQEYFKIVLNNRELMFKLVDSL